VGTGDSRPANEDQVAKLHLNDRVHFVGYVPREQIAQRYASAHVFALPSYNEGMSVALLEAMASGLPVVVTPTGGTPELVEPGINGFIFDWADVDRLTSYLHRFAQDRPLVRRMGDAARRRASDFSWETAAQRYIEIFAQFNCSPAVSEHPFSIEAKHKI
jgi:glycosyltransferase involved in cell wall biosynthesis